MNREERVVKYINSSDDPVFNGKRYCENDFYNDVEDLAKENQKYKEAFGKAKEIIMQPNIEIREYRSCDMDYVCINEQLLEILNEAIDK